MGITASNPPFSAAVFQMVYGAQPVLVGSTPSFYDFTTPLGVLPSGVTLTRASAGYRYNSSGVLVSETTNVARFQYRYTGSAWAANGLLSESAGTNLWLYSEQFDNANWSKFRSSITANSAAAPDGTTTADTLVEDGTAANTHVAGQTWTCVNATTYVLSIFAKAAGRSWLAVDVPAAQFGLKEQCYWNIGAGVGAVGTNGVTNSNAYIVDVGNGWYRCVLIKTATASAAGTVYWASASGDNTWIYNGTSSDSLYLWGANCVADTALSSYIQTTAATAARAADVALITNANAISDQCWIVRARTPRKLTAGSANTVFQLDDGTANNRRSIYYSSGNLYLLVESAGVTQATINAGAVANDTDFVIACRFADNNFAVSLNGGAIVTDLAGTNPVGLTTARIGTIASGGFTWNSTIKTIETRRTATDAELPLLAA